MGNVLHLGSAQRSRLRSTVEMQGCCQNLPAGRGGGRTARQRGLKVEEQNRKLKRNQAKVESDDREVQGSEPAQLQTTKQVGHSLQ